MNILSFGMQLTSGKLIYLELVLFVSLLINAFWILTYYKHRHLKEKYSNIGGHNAHVQFSQIQYHHWVLKHFPIFLQPKKIKKHPHKLYSLKDNVRIVTFHPHLATARRVLASWLIFSILFSSMGIYFLHSAPPVHATTNLSFQTGYYLGTGAALSITGVGFSPQAVIIKSDTAAGSAVWKSTSMPTGEYSYWGSATADNTESQITLDADGFTVQVNADVNTINVRYTYVAFAGSDCSSTGVMCVGSYSGNTSATQDIATGFQPDLVWVKRTTAVVGSFRTSAMSASNASFLSATADDATGVFFTTLNATSFTVGATNNTSGGKFYFMAFKKVTGVMDVGAYTGNGTTQTINPTGLSGVTPNFVLTKPNAASVPGYNITQSYGDYSSQTSAALDVTGAITKLQNNGFTIGAAANSNTNAVNYKYFAFAGAANPSPSGSFTMRYGSYTGNGSTQNITGIGFTPDLVFIKSNTTTDYAVWSTSLDANLTHYFANSATGIAGAVTGMISDGFSLGSNSTVNTNSIVYEYEAFGNATSPQTGAHAADFMVGSYMGNGIARSITNLGFAPDFVATKENNTASGTDWSSTSLTAGTTVFYAATADDTSSTLFTTLDSGGFTLGTNAAVNTANQLYNFFAFKKGTGTFNIGSYSGTGGSQNITGLGFKPDLVSVKQTTAVRAAYHSADSALSTNTQNYTNVANFANGITAFVSDGFTVVSDGTVNTNAGSYRYLAWKASVPTSAPNTPTNSSPANASTGNDLNPTLSASYSDPGSNVQTGATWQVDDTSDFSSPEWTRTANSAETSITVTSGHGTFANDLAGKTYLAHNTTYYWRVKYSNGVYTPFSTGTNFITNVIVTPTNSTPADGATVTTLTPTLTASAFSDPQSGHTSGNAQWQISTNSSFSSTSYDSGTVAYGSSLAVPAATLSDRTVYYWHVRYQDSDGQWSAYSTPTRFLVSLTTATATINVAPLFGSTVVDQGDSVNIDAQVSLSTDGSLINNATVTINIYNPSGTKIVTGDTMTYISGSNGTYRYAYTIPSTNGSYLYDVTATANAITGYGAGNFQVRTIAANLTSVLSTVNSNATILSTLNTNVNTANTTLNTVNSNVSTINTNVNSANTTLNTVNTNLNTANTTLNTVNSNVSTINTNVNTANTTLNTVNTNLNTANTTLNTINANVASLITEIGTGNIAAIKTKTDSIAWGDITGLVTSNGAIKAKTDTISWGDVTGIKTKTDTILWTDVTGIKTKTDTINWGDISTIKTNVASLITEIGTGNITAIKTKTDSIAWADITGLVTSSGAIQAKTDSINWADVTALKTQTDTINWADITAIKTATQTIGTNVSSLISEIGVGNIAAIKTKTDTINWADITGLVTSAGLIKASTDNINWSDVTALKTKTDTINWSDITGLTTKFDSVSWGDLANLGSLTSAIVSVIGSVSDASPSDSSFVTDLTALKDDFYKNMVITFTTGNNSGQSRRISAFSASDHKINVDPAFSYTPANGDKFVISVGSVRAEDLAASAQSTISTVQSKLQALGGTLPSNYSGMYDQLKAIADALSGLGVISGSGADSLYSLSVANKNDVNYLKNKLLDLQAALEINKAMLAGGNQNSVISSWYTFNSVVLNMLVANPTDRTATIPFKAYLPKEAAPDNVISSDGLNIAFDDQTQTYYVSGEFTLASKESITKKVEIKDIWNLDLTQVKEYSGQANDLYKEAQTTAYSAQALVLKNDVVTNVDSIIQTQENNISNPQDHIFAFRDNQAKVASIKADLKQMTDLVTSVGAGKGLVASVGGIQTVASWGIIVVLMTGLLILGFFSYTMWKHQMMVVAALNSGTLGKTTLPMSADVLADKKNEDAVNEDSATKPVRSRLRKNNYWSYFHSHIKNLLIFLVVGGAISLIGLFVVIPQAKLLRAPTPTITPTPTVVKPTPTPTPIVKKVTILETETGWLNVRQQPTTTSDILQKVNVGDTFEELGRTTDDQNQEWVKIKVDSGVGWVLGKYVKSE